MRARRREVGRGARRKKDAALRYANTGGGEAEGFKLQRMNKARNETQSSRHSFMSANVCEGCSPSFTNAGL